jgi:hypothetical protein
VELILPLDPTFEQACRIVSSLSSQRLMKNVDINIIVEAVIKVYPVILFVFLQLLLC